VKQMAVPVKSDSNRLFQTALSVFRGLGYEEPLIEEGYTFRDYFAQGAPPRTIDAALFGRLPANYDTALMGIATPNGVIGAGLVNQNRALGAPVILEVGKERIGVWAVGADEGATTKTAELDEHAFRRWAEQNAANLRPAEFLRTKNLKVGKPTFYQPSLFAGLIPELEECIGRVLDPELVRAFNDGWNTYMATAGNPPAEARLFKVAFWLLTGKVFADRRHPAFADLGRDATADEVLARVAAHYATPPGNLLNRPTREAVFSHVWSAMDFRNLSVEALSQIWSRTLITPETRKRLGIYRTRRSLVRYIVDRIPFTDFAPEDRYVLEPCSGSAGFLVAAMERMRDCPDTPPEPHRHSYFQKHLTGYERDPFGVEISQLCLALADYPHRNGWRIEAEDVFASPSFSDALRQARIVLCNPPFRKFTDAQPRQYNPTFNVPPAELLDRVLHHLHPDGVLGFVLPRTFLNGRQYRRARAALARRYRDLDILWLPDKGWESAAPETAILVAKSPKNALSKVLTEVSYGRVREQDWHRFEASHLVQLKQDRESKSVDQAEKSLAGLVLRQVWDYLEYCRPLGEFAQVSKGIEWTESQETHKHLLVGPEPFQPYSRLGVPPEASPFYAFQQPPTAYLNFDPKYQRRPKTFRLPWDQPKVILNKSAKSRGPWRLAAFADFNGLACYETFLAAWPRKENLTEALAAVLNGPVANAFVWERSGKRETTLNTIRSIPFPAFKTRHLSEITRLASEYRIAVEEAGEQLGGSYVKADKLLREIDAIVLSAYGLPPRLERQLLDFFNGDERQAPFRFADYFPHDFAPCFSLAEWITGRPAKATVERFRSQNRDLPEHILQALQRADGEGDE
jgi:hypothetical protein